MIYRFLGPTGIQVSVISYGNWINSHSKDSQDLTTRNVKQAWDLGINFFDTAEMYGRGEAEVQFGIALKALGVPRHQFVLSGKTFFGTGGKGPTSKGLSRKHIIEGLRNSLKRLQYDYVDIIYCHRPDRGVPMEEICRAHDWMIRKGWAFYWGTSEWNSEQIAEAFYVCDKYNLVKPVVEQPQYNIFVRGKLEMDFKNFLAKGQLGTTVFSPLAGGLLTGKYNDGIPEGSRYADNPDMMRIFHSFLEGDRKEQSLKALRRFKELADSFECTMAQLAMAWVIANPDVSSAITGASRP